LQIALYGISMP